MKKPTYTTRVGLNVDTPFGRVEVEGLEGTLAAEDFEFIDVLVTTVIASVGETLRVFVSQDGAIGFHGGLTRQVLPTNEHRMPWMQLIETTDLGSDKFKTGELSPCLLIDDVLDLGVDLCQRLVENLVLLLGQM